MAVLYTQFLNATTKKILTGSHSSQGIFLQEDYAILTELKHIVTKVLSEDNINIFQTNKIYSKVSENNRFVFYIHISNEFNQQLCITCITDTKSTNKTILIYLDQLTKSIHENNIIIQNPNIACYQNDEKIKQIADEFNKSEHIINTNEILQTTQNNLVENLDNLIYRGENINNLKHMAENLKFESEFISKKINEIKNREKFDKYKNYIIIFIICLVIFYFFLWRK